MVTCSPISSEACGENSCVVLCKTRAPEAAPNKSPQSRYITQWNDLARRLEKFVDCYASQRRLGCSVDLVKLFVQGAQPGVRRQSERARANPLQRRDSVDHIQNCDLLRMFGQSISATWPGLR